VGEGRTGGRNRRGREREKEQERGKRGDSTLVVRGEVDVHAYTTSYLSTCHICVVR